jgi:plastocyanin
VATHIPAGVLLVGVLSSCGSAPVSPSGPPPPTASIGQASSTVQLSSPSAPGPNPAQVAKADIVISRFAYSVPESVHPGQQLTVVNDDDPNHTVTADADNTFDIRVSGGGGFQTFTAPTAPGTYAFHCKYHNSMHGSLNVQ